MSDMNERDSNQEAVPFFARYLEGQLDYMIKKIIQVAEPL